VSLVLDASSALAWYFEDEVTAAGEALMERVAQAGAMVPVLWRYEIANGLQSAVRRKRIDPAYRDASIAELRLLPIAVDHNGDDAVWTSTLGLADRFGLTVYDAAYLELAYRLMLPLATDDHALRAAARGLAVELIEPSD
jgi:predicted nucleic acid-binding protein